MIGTPPDDANKYVRVFAMIETAEAIRNLDEILDVEGLDGVFVGRLPKFSNRKKYSDFSRSF